MSANETKLDETNKVLKLTLESNEHFLRINSMLKRDLEEAKMLNAYSNSSSSTHLNKSQNYRHSVQATAPAWDDMN